MAECFFSRKAIGFSLLAGAVFLTGCAALLRGNYLVTQGKGDVALVSFSMDRFIKDIGDTTTASGPTQHAVNQQPPEFWADQRKATNTLYTQFKEKGSPALLDAPFTDPAKIENNQAFLALTAHKPKIIMGTDIGTGINKISADGLNYVSPYDRKIVDSLCGLLGVSALLMVENHAVSQVVDSMFKLYRINGTAETFLRDIPYTDNLFEGQARLLDIAGNRSLYRISEEVKFKNNFSGFDTVAIVKIPLGNTVLTSTVFLVEKGLGITWSRSYTCTAPGDLLPLTPERLLYKGDYTDQLSAAFSKIFTNLRADAERGKAYHESKGAKK